MKVGETEIEGLKSVGTDVFGLFAVGDLCTEAGFMDATPGGRRLVTPRGNTLLPLGV